MSDTFDENWARLQAECPYRPQTARTKWSAWMFRAGNDAGLDGDLIHFRIVERLIELGREPATVVAASAAVLEALLATSATEQSEPPTLWDRLVGSWTEDEARLWLIKPHPLLEGSLPAELLAKGEVDRLHRVLNELEKGGFL